MMKWISVAVLIALGQVGDRQSMVAPKEEDVVTHQMQWTCPAGYALMTLSPGYSNEAVLGASSLSLSSGFLQSYRVCVDPALLAGLPSYGNSTIMINSATP